jgi:hypothetical protein
MTVVVHNSLIADSLYVQAWPGRAERPEAYGHTKDPVDLRPDRHQSRNLAVAWQAWESRRFSDLRRAAAQARRCNTKETTSIHQAFSQNRLGEFESG